MGGSSRLSGVSAAMQLRVCAAQDASHPTQCQNYLPKNAELRTSKAWLDDFNQIALGMPVFNGYALLGKIPSERERLKVR